MYSQNKYTEIKWSQKHEGRQQEECLYLISNVITSWQQNVIKEI